LEVQERHLGGGKRDDLEMARPMSWRWKDRHLGGGKRDVLEVARATSWRWQERHLGGGKSDVKRYQLQRGCYGSDTLGGGKTDILEVERVTLRGISSDVVSMGVTLQDVAIATML
jgi:hypothetical protein